MRENGNTLIPIAYACEHASRIRTEPQARRDNTEMTGKYMLVNLSLQEKADTTDLLNCDIFCNHRSTSSSIHSISTVPFDSKRLTITSRVKNDSTLSFKDTATCLFENCTHSKSTDN
jgi:hypothetical protein